MKYIYMYILYTFFFPCKLLSVCFCECVTQVLSLCFVFDKFVPGVTCMFSLFFFFLTIFSWCKVNLVSVKQG